MLHCGLVRYRIERDISSGTLAALVQWFKSVGRYCAHLAVKGVLGCQWRNGSGQGIAPSRSTKGRVASADVTPQAAADGSIIVGLSSSDICRSLTSMAAAAVSVVHEAASGCSTTCRASCVADSSACPAVEATGSAAPLAERQGARS